MLHLQFKIWLPNIYPLYLLKPIDTKYDSKNSMYIQLACGMILLLHLPIQYILLPHA